MTLVTNKEKSRLASRAAGYDSTSASKKENATSPCSTRPKLSDKQAARKVLGIIECDMEHKKLSEAQKNEKAGRFAAFVDQIKSRVTRHKP